MTPNVNPETGIRYGIISANNLDPDVVAYLQTMGRDVHYEEAKSELWAGVKSVCKDYLCDRDSDGVADHAVELMEFDQDEPVHEFEHDGVKGRTTWLGGALLLWIFHSPFTDQFDLCSPCVPGCCDLDSPNPDGYVGYTVPEDWKHHDR